MTNPAHLVGIGGALGAVARYVVGELLVARGVDGYEFPVTTFTVNVAGTFLLGLLTFADVGGDTMLLVGVGACGAFTTFSSFSFDTVRAWERGRPLLAVGYALGTLLAAGGALGAAWLVVHYTGL
jgi:CrcB protein